MGQKVVGLTLDGLILQQPYRDTVFIFHDFPKDFFHMLSASISED